MKIFFIPCINISKNDGQSVHVLELARNLQNQGCDITLILTKNQESILENNLKIKCLPCFPIPYLAFLIQSIYLFFYLLTWKYKNKLDLIYFRQNLYSGFLPLMAKIIRVPSISEVNGILIQELEAHGASSLRKFITKLIEKMSYKLTSKIIAVTPGIKKELHNIYGTPLSKIEVVPNGANVDLFKPIKNAKEKLNLDLNYKYVGFVGNLAPWQGVKYLIKAAPEIIKKESRAKFLIVGDGILRKKLEEMVRELGLENYFTFTGNVEYKKVPLYVNSFDICIAPFSGKDKLNLALGSPLKIFEYLACNKPVVASDIDGVNTIPNYKDFILPVPPKNTRKLSEETVFLLRNKKIALNMANIGRKTVLDCYSWKAIAKKIEKICKEIKK